MRNFLGFCLVMLTFMLASCSMERVDSGYVGVKVNLLGSDKGVQATPVGTGRYFLGPNQELYKFPTFQVNYVYTTSSDEGSEGNEEFTFQTVEGMGCSMDIGVAMHFEEFQVPNMFKKYRKGVDEIRGVVVRNSIRDALNRAAGNLSVEAVYGAGKGKLIDTVTTIVQKELGPTGIIIDKLSLIGTVRIPESIKNALDAKVAMTQEAQKSENEVAKAQADANIATAQAQGKADALRIQADGEAYYNRTVASSLTPNIVSLKWIEAWAKGGSLVPGYLSGAGTGNFMLNIPNK